MPSANPLSAPLRSELSGLVARTIGLHFPPERWEDLERGLQSAAPEFGFGEVEECARWLLSTVLNRKQIGILAKNLTVGETYFFREPRTFEILETHVIPELARARRGDRRLRIWSAACCTGEEPYSIAISLRKALPNIGDWNATILGTDLNPLFLDKATKGVFGEWSFRNAPAWLKGRCFQNREAAQWEIHPEFKNMVTFSHMNLAEDGDSSMHEEFNGMDLIFCRNVLIYFSPEAVSRVITKLHRCLREGGWLVLGSSEVWQMGCRELAPVAFDGTILFQKNSTRKTQTHTQSPQQENRDSHSPLDSLSPSVLIGTEVSRLPNSLGSLNTNEILSKEIGNPISGRLATGEGLLEFEGNGLESAGDIHDEIWRQSSEKGENDLAFNLYRQGRYAEAAETLKTRLVACGPAAREILLLTRSLANLGWLSDALQWSDKAVANDKLNPSAHYLRASILQELGDAREAVIAFKRALYLDPDFALAHFALGAAARSQGASKEAMRHFGNALTLVHLRPKDEILDETDGLTAGCLAEIITTALKMNSESSRTTSKS